MTDAQPNERSLLMVSTVPPTLVGFLLPIAERMRADGWRVDGAAHGICDSTPCVEHFDRVWNVDWSRNPLKPSNFANAISQMRSIVDRGKYRIVHVHTPVAAFITRMALRKARAHGDVDVIYTAHGFHFHERNPRLRNAAFLGLEKLAGRWTDRLVLINEYDVGQAIEHHVVDRERIVYMHGIGIDVARFDPRSVPEQSRRRLRDEIGVRADETLFLVPAEFIPRKRQTLVIDALAFAVRDDLHVAFVGTGPTLDAARAHAQMKGVDEKTHFLGWRKDIPELMKAADAVVLYSQQEGLSRAVMEALAMECPVIGSDVRGIRELIRDGCGIVVDPDRPDLLAQAFVMLASDPEWGRRMGRAGRLKMSGPYEQERIVRQHERLYEEVLAHA